MDKQLKAYSAEISWHEIVGTTCFVKSAHIGGGVGEGKYARSWNEFITKQRQSTELPGQFHVERIWIDGVEV